jgi:hypothetical protein
MVSEGPFAKAYLEGFRRLLLLALATNSRIVVLRVELWMPAGKPLPGIHFSNQVIQQCFVSMRNRIRFSRYASKQDFGAAHNLTVRYALAMDSEGSAAKYQLVIILNLDAYLAEPIFVDMFAEMESAWANAVCRPGEYSRRLLTVPEALARYQVKRGGFSMMSTVFHSLCFICKAPITVPEPSFVHGRV